LESVNHNRPSGPKVQSLGQSTPVLTTSTGPSGRRHRWIDGSVWTGEDARSNCPAFWVIHSEPSGPSASPFGPPPGSAASMASPEPSVGTS